MAALGKWVSRRKEKNKEGTGAVSQLQRTRLASTRPWVPGPAVREEEWKETSGERRKERERKENEPSWPP